jgi:hypothetical protein
VNYDHLISVNKSNEEFQHNFFYSIQLHIIYAASRGFCVDSPRNIDFSFARIFASRAIPRVILSSFPEDAPIIFIGITSNAIANDEEGNIGAARNREKHFETFQEI